MATAGITEGLIRQHADEQSFRRGQEYERSGAVLSLGRRGDRLEAEVEGSQPFPYRVHAVLDRGGIAEATCSCPYDWGGWCKHIVATLLAYAHEPAAAEERPAVEQLIAGLERDQLRQLLLKLVEREPDLADAVEAEVALLQAAAPAGRTSGAKARRAAIDPAPFRRQVRAVLQGTSRMLPSEAYWHIGGIVDVVRDVLEQAWEFIRAGDGPSALIILEAITDEYVKGWELLDDSNGEASAFFEDLGAAWTEAALTADLSSEERRTWAKKLDAWGEGLEDYGVEGAFDAALAALEQGWEYPPLRRALAGEITETGAWEDDEAPYYADDLAVARLNVLERQGRVEEYLNLAKAAGQAERYATMLVRVGRVGEAVEYGLESLATTQEAKALAEALRERGELRGALRIAEHGLSLDGPKAPLATWLCDLAAGLGETERALGAAIVAFREQPSLAAYQGVRELAGEGWPRHREELLAHIRGQRSYYAEGPVEILLHEGLIDDAIAAVEGGYDYELILRVAEAAVASRPDWVIRTCTKQAESIMDQGIAQHYDRAARWLATAREAFGAAGREEEWGPYLEAQITCHARKYKLRPMLEALRR